MPDPKTPRPPRPQEPENRPLPAASPEKPPRRASSLEQTSLTGQLLIAIETGEEPAISGRDNLKTMALVDAAYTSASEKRSVKLSEIV